MTILQNLVGKKNNDTENKQVCLNVIPPTNTIIIGDCLETLKTWPDKSIDLILTDPQYPVPGHKIDNVAKVGVEAEMLRVAGTVVIITTRAIYDFNKKYRDFGALEPRGVIRADFTGFHKDFLILASGEALNGLPEGVLTGKVKVGSYSGQPHIVDHPYALPGELVKLLLAWFSKSGQTVCDPFAGSGVVLTVAKKMDRKWLGIEIDPLYGIPLQAGMSGIVTSNIAQRDRIDPKYGNAFVFNSKAS